MADRDRTIQELLSDYAGALRDGCVPVFLKSLSRQEGQAIADSGEFWGATEVVRILNAAAFANKAVTADVGLFMSRVDANIASRLKKSTIPAKPRRATGRKSMTKPQRTEETI